MNNWPPQVPDTDRFCDAFGHMTENVRRGLHREDLSPVDKSLTQYMRTKNVGTRLLQETVGPYKNEFVVSFDTVTSRKIRQKLLRVFSPSPDEDDVFVVPTAITHAAVNGVSKREAGVLADELVGGFYEQYEMASLMGVSAKELRKISPVHREEQLRAIYDQIRQRTLSVLKNA